MRRFSGLALALALPAMTPVRGAAEVLDSASGGFTVRSVVAIKAPPDEVYRKIVRNVGEWWDSRHTDSRDARNLTIDERPGGCFCEKVPGAGGEAGGVRHMSVSYFAPGKALVLSGGLGPLLSMAVTGTMNIELTPTDGGTKATVTYAVAGYLPTGLNTLAVPVDSVLGLQFNRLKNYVENGDPAAKGK